MSWKITRWSWGDLGKLSLALGLVLKAAGAILKRSLELWKSLGSLFPTLWRAWNGKGAFYENMLLARAGEWSGTSWGGLGAVLSRLGAIVPLQPRSKRLDPSSKRQSTFDPPVARQPVV